jgi:hypothetical protein
MPSMKTSARLKNNVRKIKESGKAVGVSGSLILICRSIIEVFAGAGG